MKWDRIEREATITRVDSGLVEVRRLVGWVCSTCGHTNWADRRPEGGCWVCNERDTETGSDVVMPREDKERESLVIRSGGRRKKADEGTGEEPQP